VLQLFDSWAGELSPHDFAGFSLPYVQYIATEVRQQPKAQELSAVPIIPFIKGANRSLKNIAQTSG